MGREYSRVNHELLLGTRQPSGKMLGNTCRIRGTKTMSITIELPDAVMARLTAQAAGQGLPLAEFVQRVLTLRGSADALPKTGAELVAYWQQNGLIGFRSDIIDSQRYARELRAEAEHRTQG